MLPTSIIGSLPRPSWYTAALGAKSFLEAMVNARYREQYEDAVCVHLRAQETAGLDICTDGDAHYDDEVGGMSWQSYPLRHMAGFNAVAEPAIYNVGAVAAALTGRCIGRSAPRHALGRGSPSIRPGGTFDALDRMQLLPVWYSLSFIVHSRPTGLQGDARFPRGHRKGYSTVVAEACGD